MANGFWAAVVQSRIDVITDPARRDEIINVNRTRAMNLIDTILGANAQPPRLFQFPVLFLQGAYNEARSAEDRYKVSLELPGDDIAPLLDFCAKRDIYIASSFVERRKELPGWMFHSGGILGPNGLVIRYPKAQARSSAGIRIIKDHYDQYVSVFGKENVFPVADTPIGKLAITVEAEILVPEVARAFAAKGAEVLLQPTVEHVRGNHAVYDAIRAARAFENRMYIISANVGNARMEHPITHEITDLQSRGHSSIVGPDGAIITSIAGPGEAYASAYVDIEQLRAGRETPSPDRQFAPVLYQDVYRLEN